MHKWLVIKTHNEKSRKQEMRSINIDGLSIKQIMQIVNVNDGDEFEVVEE